MTTNSIETLLIDLDDTLIGSGHLFDIANFECGLILVRELQNDAPSSERILDAVYRISHIPMENGKPIAAESYPLSWLTYYDEVCERLGRTPRPEIKSALVTAASQIVAPTYLPYPGVHDTLKDITQQRKIIVTLGNVDIQSHKIRSAGLDTLVNDCEIVNVKREDTYVNIINKYNLDPNTTVMIGDNYRYDIVPVMGLGMRAFHVRKPQKDYQNVDAANPLYTSIASFNDIKQYI